MHLLVDIIINSITMILVMPFQPTSHAILLVQRKHGPSLIFATIKTNYLQTKYLNHDLHTNFKEFLAKTTFRNVYKFLTLPGLYIHEILILIHCITDNLLGLLKLHSQYNTRNNPNLIFPQHCLDIL